MAQLDPTRYKRLTKSVEYGVSDGLYWDSANNELVLVIDDTVKFKLPQSQTANYALISDGTDVEPAAVAGSVLALPSEARGDVIRRGASAWERHAAKASGQILIGDGTDVVSTAVTGDVTITGGGVTAIGATKVTNAMLAGSVTRAKLLQEASASYVIPITEMRVWDARQTVLPGTAANDDMAIVTGAFGTDAPTLQGVDFGGTSTDEKCAFQFRLPPEYDAGETIIIRLACAMLTTVSDGTATVDVECHKCDGEGAVGSDLCATAAQSINSLSNDTVQFTITPTGLTPGTLLDIRLSFAGSDVGNLGVMIPEISEVAVLLDIKG
jgi:hypothetical protein